MSNVNMPQVQRNTLPFLAIYNRQGSHDKVYVYWLNEVANTAPIRYEVRTAWGRRSLYLRGGKDSLPQKIIGVFLSFSVAVEHIVDEAAKRISRKGYTLNLDGITQESGGFYGVANRISSLLRDGFPQNPRPLVPVPSFAPESPATASFVPQSVETPRPMIKVRKRLIRLGAV